jgi:ABC-2 type transport system permease protein
MQRTTNSTSLPGSLPVTQRSGMRGALGALRRSLIRTRAYFSKEISELRRQPLLILSLVGGPLLVLLLFGASYRTSNPVIRTAVVLPPGGISVISADQIRKLAGINFQIQEITEDRAAAEQKLHNGQLDLIQIVPDDASAAVEQGQSPEIVFRSNAINPLTEGWIQYLAYAEVNEINKALLREQAVVLQKQATSLKDRLSRARTSVDELDQHVSSGDADQTKRDLRDMRELLTDIDALLPATGPLMGGEQEIARTRADIARMQTQIDSIEKAVDEGTVASQSGDLHQMSTDLQNLEQAIDVFVRTPPDVIVAPVRQKYENMRGSAYQPVVFYAPGVLALLLQHTAITLGALALVRERLMGAFEVFRVTPANMVQLLIGKYLSYTLFIVVSAAVLIGGMYLLGVPFYPNVLTFTGLVVMLTLASLGVGFLISAVARSDSQAIQLAMLSLLLSIFFSGFFLAIDSFIPIARSVSYVIPMTHGLIGFQAMMLRGLPPDPQVWGALSAIAILTFLAVVLLTRRQMLRI